MLYLGWNVLDLCRSVVRASNITLVPLRIHVPISNINLVSNKHLRRCA